jgi:hypothetical protein
MEKQNELEEYFNDVTDLGNGMTSEEMKALYFDADALRAQPRPVYRVGGTAKRLYYTLNEGGEPFFYSSVTALISQTTPTSPHLIKWIAEKGWEEAENYKHERADYGTFMHLEIGSLLINKKIDLDLLHERLKAYIEEKGLPTNFIYHEEELKKDVLAFAQFCIDFKVKPLAVEIILANEDMGVGGAVDMVCELTIEKKGFFGEVYKSGPRKGEPKESKEEQKILAIVDFKSGRKGFFEGNELQLEIYRRLWNIHFPDMEVENIFNWSPKDWRGETPTYNFTDQTDSKSLAKIPYLLEIGRIERSKQKNSVLITQGEINLATGDLRENFYNLELSELIKQKNERI